LAVRGKDGRIQYYPLVQNQHRDGILRISSCPAPSSSGTPQREAERYASALLEHLDYIGVLALELFEVDGRLFANEFAPRVHNSGHFSIEAAATSQFANHLRAILGLPIGRTELVAPAAMINLIGGHPAPELLLREPDVRLHLYGKALRRGRKVGHLTLTAASEAALAQRVAALRELIEPTQDG
jgi:5-(carboxyamino)imidazole ribonucleotide synthase